LAAFNEKKVMRLPQVKVAAGKKIIFALGIIAFIAKKIFFLDWRRSHYYNLSEKAKRKKKTGVACVAGFFQFY